MRMKFMETPFISYAYTNSNLNYFFIPTYSINNIPIPIYYSIENNSIQLINM